MKKRILFAAFAACLLAGCDNDDLEKRVDSLENRLEIVEKTLTEINSGISSLQSIVEALQNGKSVSNVEETATGYVITFSDGSTITLKHGKDGTNGQNATAPVIGMAESEGAYYWTVTIDGETQFMENNGKKVPVTGNTPKMGVDENGFWTVDTGNGPEQVKDEEGNPITELEVGYNDFKRFKVKANYRFAVTNKPSWVDLEGNVLVGASNKEVTGGLEVHNNDDDANFGKYAITKEDGYTLTFASEDGKHEEKVPVVFSGMPANDMDITGGPTSNKWSWTISEDGKTFTNGAGVAGGGGTSYNKHVSFTLKAKNDDFKIVMIDEYTLDDEVQREVMNEEWGWMHYAIHDKCKINLTADELVGSKRTAYVLAFPPAKYEEIKDDVIGNAFDEAGELKTEYERYLLMLATQDVKKEQTDASVTVTAMDMMTGQTITIPLESIDATKYNANEAYSMPQGTYFMYNIDPQMGSFDSQLIL